MKKTIEAIRAKIYLLSTEEGGRITPIYSRYRAGVFLRPDDSIGGNDGLMVLEDRDICFPGEECFVRIYFHCPELVQELLKVNAQFELREGFRVIGRGRILELLEE